jgi:hypothetical protein
MTIVKRRYPEKSSQDTAGWKKLSVCFSDLQIVEIGDNVVVMCSYDL